MVKNYLQRHVIKGDKIYTLANEGGTVEFDMYLPPVPRFIDDPVGLKSIKYKREIIDYSIAKIYQ